MSPNPLLRPTLAVRKRLTTKRLLAHRQAQPAADEGADELVVEVLEAKIAERFGPRDDTPPELLLGRVGIPLRTVYSHVASEGWHNLVSRNQPSVSCL